MTDPVDPWDRALISSLAGEGDRLATLDELAESSGVSTRLLETLVREELLIPRVDGPEPRYDPADADAVRSGLALVESGLPLAELLALARRMTEAMRPIAEDSVEVFARFVRDSIEAGAGSGEQAAAAVAEALQTMLPAAGSLVASHFRRLVIATALERLERG